MVGGGTISQSVYLSIRREPDNQFCKAIVASGLTPVIDLHAKTPRDQLIYFKNEGNAYHDGGSYTWIEGVMDRPFQTCC